MIITFIAVFLSMQWDGKGKMFLILVGLVYVIRHGPQIDPGACL
ncbi:MAG: hypothetical protein ACI9R3_001170 [Verrucomicrobiales bacterium]|jgi:hypothetical protein